MFRKTELCRIEKVKFADTKNIIFIILVYYSHLFVFILKEEDYIKYKVNLSLKLNYFMFRYKKPFGNSFQEFHIQRNRHREEKTILNFQLSRRRSPELKSAENLRRLCYDIAKKEMSVILFQLDKKIQKDATSKVSSRPGTGKFSNAPVPSIVVHNGSPKILCSLAEAPSLLEGSQQQIVEKGEDLKKFKMSVSEEPIVNQHTPTMNNMVTVQRPTNCLPMPPPVTPPTKQNSLNTPPASTGNRNLTKSISVPTRSKVDRNVNKQDNFETDGMTTAAQRLRGNPKVKLLQRSHAVREETSPPREVDLGQTSPNNSNEKLTVNKTMNGINSNNNNNTSNHIHNNSNSNNLNTNNKVGNAVSQANNPNFQGSNSLQVNNSMSRPSSRHKLRHQGSSQGSMENSSPCLSRDSSTEQYTDNSGIDLNQFIAETLNRNYKDRILLLQIEQDLITLVKDAKRAYQKFPVMSSYQRMLVHRVAAFFGMDHNVDQSGNCVVVNITSSTRIPEVRFSELIRDDCRYGEEPRRCILKRDSSSFEEGMQLRSPERQLSGDSRRSKSFEEREEEYERARKRIFNRDDGLPIGSPYRAHDTNSRRSSHEDLRWHGEPQPWSSSDSDICSGKGRQTSITRSNRISKVESFEGNDTLKANSLKGSVSKSYSFGGYPGMTRGDSVSSASSRALIKQADSVTSSVSSARLSPSSSGYKSQSARSDATASTTPSPNQATSQRSFSPEPNTVVWAVSSLTAVPPGAVLINPSSGQPYTNPDGSLYRYDPDNPIKLRPTVEEDVPTNTISSPATGTLINNEPLGNSVEDKKTPDFVGTVELEITNAEVTSQKANSVLINSSTSPSLPELPRNDAISTKDNKPHHSEASGRAENRKLECPGSYQKDASQNDADSGHLYSNVVETVSADVAQTNFNGTESESCTYNNNAGNNSVSGATTTTCQEDGKEYPGQNTSMSYPVNFAVNSNIHPPEYGSQAASSGAFLNSSVGITPVNYAVGPSYSAEPVHMAPEMLYSQSVVYASGQHQNPYGVVHAPVAPTTPAAPPPPPPAGPAQAPPPAYESRPNEGNPSMTVPELNNYFMGLNIGNEQIPQTATPAPQLGYWGPSPSTSQTQGSSHSSQIQMYYLPGSMPAGTIHPKYTPTAASMYTYNVPPVVYPTEICQSLIPSTATAVFQTPYYAPSPNTTMSYRAPTPPTPSAVAATAVAPTSFFVYHPQTAAAAPPPQPIQFGMVRPQQQVPGIRSSPPTGPRPRMPYNRPVSERARHGSLNMDPKASNLHFSSPLSVYGLRFMPSEIQPIGMMRPVANVRPAAGANNSNPTRHPIVTQCCASDLNSSRPPRPRKQR